MSKYTTLILANEVDNAKLLHQQLNEYCDKIGAIYTATTLVEAIAICVEYAPLILFLDVDSLNDDETNFTLLEKCYSNKCEIIFISASDKYAIKAISHNACAYLIKPIAVTNLVASWNKAIAKLEGKEILQNIKKEKDELTVPLRNKNIIAISSTDKISFFDVKEIMYCEADGKYTKFFLSNEIEYVSSRNIGEYEDLLNKSLFFRIHHKYIVNIKYISSINKKDGFYCELKNNKKIPVAKRRQEMFIKFLRLKV